MRLPAQSSGHFSIPPPIGDGRKQFGHVQPVWKSNFGRPHASTRRCARNWLNSTQLLQSFVYGADEESLQGWHSVGQSPRNPPIDDLDWDEKAALGALLCNLAADEGVNVLNKLVPPFPPGESVNDGRPTSAEAIRILQELDGEV